VTPIDITPEKPPAVLFTVDRTRIRAGKGVLKIAPTGWAGHSGGKPSMVIARGHYYSLSECYTDAREAMAVGRAIVQEEMDLEEARYAAIRARIVAAHHDVLTAFRRLTEETAA
jgi:hypothetical protein